MVKGVVLNEELTGIMEKNGMNMKFYDILCPVCGKKTEMMIGPTEDLEVRVEIHLAELIEYHTPNDWVECDEPETTVTETETNDGEAEKPAEDSGSDQT